MVLIDKDDIQYGLYEPIARNKDINLIEAIKRNRLDVLQCMKDLGIDFQTCLDKQMMTPMEAAARWGHVNIIDFLLKCGEDINHRNVLFQTPLYSALQYKNKDAVSFLLDKKASTDLRDAFGQSPVLFYIMVCGCRTDSDLEIFKLLLEAGASVTTGDAQTGLLPLHAVVCKSGIPDKTAQLLLKYITDIDAKCAGGWSALHFCCATHNDVLYIEEIDRKRRCDTVKLLLQNGADANVVDDKFETPLHLAARNGFAKVAEILVEYGADPTHRDIEGNRPIEYAQPQSGVWYVLRSAIREKRGSGKSTPRSSPLPQSGSRVFFPDKDDVDATEISDSHEHVSVAVATTPPCNPREEAWRDVNDKLRNLETSFVNKDTKILQDELALLKQSLGNLKDQENFIFNQIWPGGYPPEHHLPPLGAKSKLDTTATTKPTPMIKLQVDVGHPTDDVPDSQIQDPCDENSVLEDKLFFKGCRIASDLMGLDWKMVFRDMEVYDPLKAEIVIKEIEQKNQGQLREQSYQALLNWKQIKGREATLGVLLKHLRECSLVNVAQTIQDKLS